MRRRRNRENSFQERDSQGRYTDNSRNRGRAYSNNDRGNQRSYDDYYDDQDSGNYSRQRYQDYDQDESSRSYGDRSNYDSYNDRDRSNYDSYNDNDRDRDYDSRNYRSNYSRDYDREDYDQQYNRYDYDDGSDWEEMPERRNSERGFSSMSPEEVRRLDRRGGYAYGNRNSSQDESRYSSNDNGGSRRRGRGFASMSQSDVRRIGAKGGRASHRGNNRNRGNR